jgi:hypothetical protein
MAIGVAIVLLLVLRLLRYVGIAWDGLPDSPPLVLVGEGLAISAGVELAYMLFTPGPDEAIEPVMLGIAAAILIVASDPALDLDRAFIVLLLALALAVMVGLRSWMRRERAVEDAAKPGAPEPPR